MGNLLEIVIILALIVLNGVFAMSETAIVSVKRIRLQQRAEAGDERARAALELVKNPERFLSTVQIGITLIGILAGAFGGARLSEDLTKLLAGWGVPDNISASLAFFLVVSVITYLSLVIGELVPKSLALNDPENVSCRVAGPMQTLSRGVSPLVSLLTLSTSGMLKILGVRDSGEPPVTEDEIKLLIAQGTRAGVFEDEEQEIVAGVFRTADRRVSSLMTPRREIVFLDVQNSWDENRDRINSTGYAAYPVCDGGLDNVLGMISVKTLWATCTANITPDLATLVRKPVFLLESTRALQALEMFKGHGRHVALVVDEYGQVVGLITLHDVIEAMVGDVPDAQMTFDPKAVQREDGSWLLDGLLPVEEFIEHLGLREEPDDADEYATLGGFVMARLGRIPAEGDRFDWHGVTFEVVDMDGNRVDRVLAHNAESSAADSRKEPEPTAKD
ncbi:MAG: hemolysin family protein [Armatimonadaceae bacterium]